MVTVEQGFPIRLAHRPDLLDKKIPFHRQLPDLGVEILDCTLRPLLVTRRSGIRPPSKADLAFQTKTSSVSVQSG
jgi:hypothetical protein